MRRPYRGPGGCGGVFVHWSPSLTKRRSGPTFAPLGARCVFVEKKFQWGRMYFRELTSMGGGDFLREDRCWVFLKFLILERISNEEDRMEKDAGILAGEKSDAR